MFALLRSGRPDLVWPLTSARCGLQQHWPSLTQQLIEQTSDESVAREADAETGPARSAATSAAAFRYLIQSCCFMYGRSYTRALTQSQSFRSTRLPTPRRQKAEGRRQKAEGRSGTQKDFPFSIFHLLFVISQCSPRHLTPVPNDK